MRTKVFVVVLVVGLLGWTMNGTTVTAEPTYDAREMFEALYFASGPAVEAFPQLDDVPPPDDGDGGEDAASLRTDVMDAIDDIDSNFYQSFESALYSGNHGEIEATLLSGIDMVVSGIDEVEPGLLEQCDKGCDHPMPYVAAVHGFLVLVHTVAWTIAAVDNAVYHRTAGPGATDPEDSLLRFEELVDYIAVNMGA